MCSLYKTATSSFVTPQIYKIFHSSYESETDQIKKINNTNSPISWLGQMAIYAKQINGIVFLEDQSIV